LYLTIKDDGKDGTARLAKPDFDRVRRDLDFLYFFEALQQNNVAYYIYYLLLEILNFVTNTDAVVSMKSNRDLLIVSTKSILPK
jgi:uncharacterized protein YbcV (DUF1398 family)